MASAGLCRYDSNVMFIALMETQVGQTPHCLHNFPSWKGHVLPPNARQPCRPYLEDMVNVDPAHGVFRHRALQCQELGPRELEAGLGASGNKAGAADPGILRAVQHVGGHGGTHGRQEGEHDGNDVVQLLQDRKDTVRGWRIRS